MDSKGVKNRIETQSSSTSSVNSASKSSARPPDVKHIPSDNSSHIPETPIQQRKPLILPRDEQLRMAILKWLPFASPTEIPPVVSPEATQRAKSFNDDVEKVLSTGVPGTSALQFSTAHAVIKTLDKGNIHVPPGKRLGPGFHMTDRGYEVHSSVLAVDAPFHSQATSFEDQVMVNSVSTEDEAVPKHSWLHHQLSSEPKSQSPLEKRQDSLLNEIASLDENYGLPEQHLREVQESLQKHQEQFGRIDQQSRHLQTAVKELSAEATELANLLKTHNESANMHSTDAARIAHDTHTLPQADSIEHKTLQKKLRELEKTLEESLLANKDLEKTQKDLRHELTQKQQATQQLTAEIEQLKAHKDQLETELSRLTEETRLSKFEIDRLQQDKHSLISQIQKHEAALLTQLNELKAMDDLLTAAEQAHIGCHSEILNLKQQVAQLTSKEDGVKRQLFNTQQQLQNSNEKNIQVEASLKAANQKLTSALKEIQNLKIATNTRKLDNEKWEREWQRERQNTQRIMEEYQTHIAQLKSHHNFALNLNKTLAKKNRKTQEALEGSREQLRNTAAKLKTVDDELTKLGVAHQDLQATCKAQEDTVFILREENAALQEGLKKANTSIEEFEQKDASLLKAIQENDQNAPSDNLENAVTHILSKNVGLTTQLGQVKTQYSEAVLAQQEQRQEIHRLHTDLQKQQSALSIVTDKLKATEETLQERTDEVKTTTELLKYAKQELKGQRNSSNTLRTMNRTLSDEVSKLESSSDKKDKDIQQLKLQLKAAHEHNESLAQNNRMLHEKLDQEKAANASHAQTIETLRSELDGSAKKNLDLQRDINQLRKELQASEVHWSHAAVKMEYQQQGLRKAEILHQGLQATIRSQNILLQERDAEIEELQKIADMTNELSQENTKLLQRITTTERLKTELTETIKQITHEYNVVSEQASLLTKQVKSLTKELLTEQARTKEVEQERDLLIESLRKEEGGHTASKVELKQTKKKLSSKQKELAEKEKKLITTQKSTDVLRSRLANNQREMEKLQKAIEGDFSLERPYKAIPEGDAATDKTSGHIYNKLHDLGKTIEGLQTRVQLANQEIHKKEADILSKRMALEDKHNHLIKAQTERNDLSRQLKDASAEIQLQIGITTDQSKKLLQASKDIKKLEKELKNKEALWETERKHLKETLEERTTEVENLVTEKGKVDIALTNLEVEKQTLTTQYAGEILLAKTELSQLKNTNTQLELTAQKWEAISKDKEESLQTLHKQHDATIKELSDMQADRDLKAQKLEKLNQKYRETTQSVVQIEGSILKQIEDLTNATKPEALEDSLPPPKDSPSVPDHMNSSILFITQKLYGLTQQWRETNATQKDLDEKLKAAQNDAEQAKLKLSKVQKKYNDLEKTSTQESAFEKTTRLHAVKQAQDWYKKLQEAKADIEEVANICILKEKDIIKLEEKLKEAEEKVLTVPDNMVTAEAYEDAVEKMRVYCEQLQRQHKDEIKILQQKLDQASQDRNDSAASERATQDRNLELMGDVIHGKVTLLALLDYAHSSVENVRVLISLLKESAPASWDQESLIQLLEDIEENLLDGNLGWKRRLEELAQNGVTPTQLEEGKAEANAHRVLSMYVGSPTYTPPHKSSNSDGDSGIDSGNNSSSELEIFESKGDSDDKYRPYPPSPRMKVARRLPPQRRGDFNTPQLSPPDNDAVL